MRIKEMKQKVNKKLRIKARRHPKKKQTDPTVDNADAEMEMAMAA